MLTPEFIFAIEQEHGEGLLMQLMDHQLFTKVFNTIMNVFITFCVMIFASKTTISIVMLMFDFLNYTLTTGWNLLTPGNKLLEAAMIVSTISMFITMMLAMNEMTNQLDNSFTILREQCREKDKRILELESYVKILINDPTLKNETTLKNDKPKVL